MRAASNGGGGYKIIDNANAELKSASQVFKLPGFTITGVSDLPGTGQGEPKGYNFNCYKFTAAAGTNTLRTRLYAFLQAIQDRSGSDEVYRDRYDRSGNRYAICRL